MTAGVSTSLAAPTRTSHVARTVREVLDRERTVVAPADGWRSPFSLGFDLLDRVLEGGLRVHDLLLLGGRPGVGKTVAALQMARHVARTGRTAVYVSYEHDEATMLARLLVLELGEHPDPGVAPEIDRLRTDVVAALAGFRGLEDLVATEPLLADAVARLHTYADRLIVLRGSGAHTDLEAIESTLVNGDGFAAVGVVFVDYLQKVAVTPEPTGELEKVTRIAEGLKDLALRHEVAVVALVAADQDGVRGGRTRLHHLRGSSALAYECDVAVLMNDKHTAVAPVHLEFDPVKAESFHRHVVFSIEKNRGGPSMVDLEFRKDFMHYRFETHGGFLAERLADDRLAGG